MENIIIIIIMVIVGVQCLLSPPHWSTATQRKLIVPRYRLNGFSRRRFAVAGPSTWNSLTAFVTHS